MFLDELIFNYTNFKKWIILSYYTLLSLNLRD